MGFRFVYGIRTVTPVFLGADGYPAGRFVALDVVGGLAWKLSLGGLGWALGASLETVLQRATRVEEVLGAAVAGAFALWVVARWVQRRRLLP